MTRKWSKTRKSQKVKIWETPAAKGRNEIQQADSILKWWRAHCREVRRGSNKMLLSDITDIAYFLRRFKGLKRKSKIKGSEKLLLERLRRMLRAAVFDAAADIARFEEREMAGRASSADKAGQAK